MDWATLEVSSDGTHHVAGGGEPAYAERFDEVLRFHAPGLAPVRRAGAAWHIDARGRAAYGRRFLLTFGFYEGRAAVASAGGWHHVHPTGDDAYAARFAWCGNYQQGRCAVRDGEGRYLHIDPGGAPAYRDRWRYAGDYREGSAVVQAADGRSTHVDLGGAPVHGRWFDDLDVFHKGFARARDEGGWMHVDRNGRPAYARRFAAVEPFYNGQARCQELDGGRLVIDESGRTVTVIREARRLDPRSWTQVGRFQISLDDILRRRPWGTVRGAVDGGGHPAISKSTRARHDREHEALLLLRGHPRVPRVLGREQLGDTDWLFLERRPGRILGDRNRCEPRSEAAALRIADQVLDVCEHLHAEGLVHTDLQPSNILDAAGEVTVLDFEHAVRLDHRGLWAGELNWGVWEFVPPEQLADFTVLDASADVYAVATLLAYLIRGEVPFRFRVMETHRAGGWDAVRRRFLELRATPQLDRLRAGVRSAVEQVLLAPFGRRPTARAFRQALQEVARGA